MSHNLVFARAIRALKNLQNSPTASILAKAEATHPSEFQILVSHFPNCEI